jgi:hypothetical protein
MRAKEFSQACNMKKQRARHMRKMWFWQRPAKEP